MKMYLNPQLVDALKPRLRIVLRYVLTLVLGTAPNWVDDPVVLQGLSIVVLVLVEIWYERARKKGGST